MNNTIIVYTDGACTQNGRVGAKAGAGVYFGKDDLRNMCSLVPGLQTNNRAEAYAVICALRQTDPHIPLEIRTDSILTIRCIQKIYSPKKNLDLFDEIDRLLKERHVKFTWVKGHNGDEGNEGADALAKMGASMDSV